MRSAVISIVLSILSTTILGATTVSDPNSTGSKIKFVIDSNTPMKWTVLTRSEEGVHERFNPPGPIRPAYAASIRIRDDEARSHSQDEVLDRINDSPIAKKFSESQQEFLKTGFAVRADADAEDPYQYYVTYFYAVSEEDAKLMARAYLDGLTRSAEQAVAKWKNQLDKSQEKLRAAQKELPEKEARLKACEEKYKQQKDKTYKFSSDDEAAKLAKENILEMEKAHDRLEVEMIGIRAKLDAIQKYRDKTAQDDALYAKLNEMYVEQMIEMSGLEARWAATEDLRAKQQAFLNVYNEHRDLSREVGVLIKAIDVSKTSIRDMTELLTHPKANTMLGNMLPPEVYQNTITIHPVAP
ncbi:MAG: hypothetical protein P8Z79_07765 [Sedimentisphaerales bacterium]|jgi:hypothetical protein